MARRFRIVRRSRVARRPNRRKLTGADPVIAAGAIGRAAGAVARAGVKAAKAAAPHVRKASYAAAHGRRQGAIMAKRSKRAFRAVKSSDEFSKSAASKFRGVPLSMKLLSQNLITRRYRFQGVNRQNAANGTVDALGQVTLGCPGYYQLNLDTNFVGGTQRFPLHLYDLTSAPVSSSAVSPVTNAGELTFSDTGTVVFASLLPVGQQGTGGTIDNNWNLEYSSQSRADPLRTRYVTTSWYTMNLLLYGARTQMTEYDIALVRFKDRALDPLESTTRAEDVAKRNSTWQNLVKPLIFNPVLPASRGTWNDIQVLMRRRVRINPSRTDEADRNPNSHLLKLFYRDGKTRDHNYAPPQFASDAALNSAQYVTEDASALNFNDAPKPGARLYLMVRCVNTTPVTTGQDANNTPSYDICIRKQVMLNTT